MKICKALTIAGSDSSGGAGLQADLKTFQECNVYGMTAITTIVAQDPDNEWFHNVFPLPLKTVQAQLETIVAGIGIDAVKTGMLGSTEIIELVGGFIDKYQLANVVIDPVLICKGADEVLHPETAISLRDVLVPRATVVTPNLFEAAQLSGRAAIKSIDDMKEAAAAIHKLGAKYVLIKGGAKLQHESAVDLLFDGNTYELLEAPRIKTSYTHGAGCTYAAAITAQLAQGHSVQKAVKNAKQFITAAIAHSFALNTYVGPTHHAALRLYHN